MTTSGTATHDDIDRLTTRVQALEQERRHLLAIIEILQEIAGSLQFVDIVQSVARRLGEAFGLDRSSIFLTERGGEVFRTEGYLRPFHLGATLDYVASGAYRGEPSFQRYLQARADRMRAEGKSVDLWE